MNIPPSIQNRLLEDSASGALVLAAWNSFGNLLKSNPQRLFFFPEYTDHDAEHLGSVLRTADKLITVASRELLTPEDATVSVMAVLLHDCAMHLSSDGFMQIIQNDKPPLVPDLDRKTWAAEFDSFYAEAQRWDEQKLYRILGDQNKKPNIDELATTVRRHPTKNSDSEQWTVQYRKFLGEFVRRHHARLAHEIGIASFPGTQSTVSFRLDNISPSMRDLAGLVARSHNMGLRATFDYLRRNHGGGIVSCRGVHPVYLMVLLRIADYLQIDATRVSKGFLGIQRLRSPISQEEWDAHLAISEIRPDERDDESIYVFAEPNNATTFLKLRKLLAGLQEELDISWAVLGEVYSRDPNANKLGLTLRRIRSNLDDGAAFIQNQHPTFYPIHAAFDAAGSQLLKLLIKPLYGDNPEIGIRELLQNSVDAVREAEQYIRDHPEYQTVSRRNQKPDIAMGIERVKDDDWFFISDKGIGMTADTVRDYFLKAGASFRHSDAWWRDFGIGGRSKVLRSGRFGVGALAAFLLGPQIQLLTRHIAAPVESGVSFDASIDHETIELCRVSVAEIGTCIKIKLPKNSASDLRSIPSFWDWYVLTKPTIERSIRGKIKQAEFSIPMWTELGAGSEWRVFKPEGYEAAQWTYPKHSVNRVLACNGIIIRGNPSEDRFPLSHLDRVGGFLVLPSLVVHDPDARLPLNLQRSELSTDPLPLVNDLMVDVFKDFLAFLLVHGPRNLRQVRRFLNLEAITINNYNVWHGRFSNGSILFAYEDGFGVLHPSILKACGVKRMLIYLLRRRDLPFRRLYANEIPQAFNFVKHDRKIEANELMWLTSRWADERAYETKKSAMLILNQRSVTTRKVINAEEKNDLKKIALEDNASIFQSKEFRKSASLLKSIHKQIVADNDTNVTAVTEIHFDWPKAKVNSSAFSEVWSKLCPQPIIPFEYEKRRRCFAEAFRYLKDYISNWEGDQVVGWRKRLINEIRNQRGIE